MRMDKDELETYLSSSSEINSSRQLLVVQEDGTFLCFNRPIQYVQQVEDVKNSLERVQACNMLDIPQQLYIEGENNSPQQLYIQGENSSPQQLYIEGENSSEVISASDQYILPEVESNVYETKYILQDDGNAKEIQMEQDESDQYEQVTATEDTIVEEEDIDNGANKNSGDCTEITLNDEQYQLLEEKGWILLESGDKMYLLDSSGLHDITADEKMIQKLKAELQEDPMEEEDMSSFIKKEKEESNDNKESFVIKIENTQLDAQDGVEDREQYVVESAGLAEENESYRPGDSIEGSLQTVAMKVEESSNDTDVHHPIEVEHDYVKLSSVAETFARKKNNVLTVKTALSFRDIPPEIMLGKFNGKKLIARVVKTKRRVRPLGTPNHNKNDTDPKIDQTGFAGLDDNKLESLIRGAVRGTVECGAKDVTAAEIVVGQLARVPAFRAAIMERGLIITKVILRENEDGEFYSESSLARSCRRLVASLVTGRAVRDNNCCRFKFVPEMLRILAMSEENRHYEEQEGGCRNYDFLHIHVRETEALDGIIRISITLNERHIPLHLFNDDTSPEARTVYACSVCASVYSTDEGLRLHQETECSLTDNNTLTIDTDEAINAYKIVNTNRGKQYACNVCNIVYTTLANCQEHIKTHCNDVEPPSGKKLRLIRVDDTKSLLGLYRCKMCVRAFLNAAALSKHIATRHIKRVDVN